VRVHLFDRISSKFKLNEKIRPGVNNGISGDHDLWQGALWDSKLFSTIFGQGDSAESPFSLLPIECLMFV
jgi:hypothetical protein